jgi:cell division septation protein DedD
VNRSLDSDFDDPHQDEPSTADREISLGMPTILGIFFALALVCACFFGFGYTLGRKSGQNAANAAIMAPTSSSVTVKPAAGSVTADPAPVRMPAAAPPAETVTQPIEPPAPVASNATTAADPRPASGSAPAPAVAPSGTFMVQIAAVSSQDIADIEVAALKKYGYDVVIRHEPTDQLLHVQIGPYATRKEAEAMRQNILAHGFNAIVK